MVTSHISWPILASLCYVEAPVWIPKTNLRAVAVVHNTALTAFSGYMFYTLTYELHRPERKMRQNAVMIFIFYNYVSNNLLDVPL
jgi:hypothetical protein